MKANTIEEALNLFDPQRPLLEEFEIKSYYVARDNSPLEEMKTILKTATDFPKLLFTGPPGCGKRTELVNLRESLKKDFHIIMFSIKDISNVYSVSLHGMLFFILQKIADKAKNEKLSIYPEKLEKMVTQPFYESPGIESLFQLKTEKRSEKTPDYSASERDDEEDDLSEFIPRIPQRYSSKNFIELINATVWDLEEKTKKDCLIIVSDIDKISVTQASIIFTKLVLHLTKLNCFAVFTFPSQFKHYPDFLHVYRHFAGVYFLPNFAIADRDGNPDEKGRAKLKEIVSKRATTKLIYDDAMELIIKLSGGNLHELINFVRQCCIVSMMEKIGYIDYEVVLMTETRIRKVYNSVYNDETRQMLLKVKNEKKFLPYDKFFTLINQFSVIEYGVGDELWFDINPILNPLIEGLEVKENETTQGG